ncbi:DUF2079 domain-containing protein [soil metagenome]
MFWTVHDKNTTSARAHRAEILALVGPLAVWLGIYPARLLIAHARFATNAYDLSVFDYALWSTLTGDVARVPFMNQSLWSDHFMPTLLTLVPLYFIWPSPVVLIVVQFAAFSAAAALLWKLGRSKISPLMLTALIVAFLFGRRSHSAVTSVFYIESLEPLLILLVLLAWERGRLVAYCAALVLALGCKEDMAIYGIMLGGLQFARRDGRLGALTLGLSTAWLLTALLVAIPAARAADRLPAMNAFWQGRVQEGPQQPDAAGVVRRVISIRTGERLALLVASTGFFALAGPEWLVVALPGTLLNFLAHPGTVQAGLTGHYLWPSIPWLFWAAVQGGRRVSMRAPNVSRALSIVLILVTVIDSPLWISFYRGFPVSSAVAADMRSTLDLVPFDAAVRAQPNLIPHLPHRQTIQALGSTAGRPEPEWVLLTHNGDLWPLDTARVASLEACYDRSPLFVRISRPDSPVTIFRRTGQGLDILACSPNRGSTQ